MNTSKIAWEELGRFHGKLMELATVSSVAEILSRESHIVKEAIGFNIAVDLPTIQIEKVEYLQHLEQQIRIKKSGFRNCTQSIVVAMEIPTGSEDSFAELVFNYDMDNNLINAYTRFAERAGQRAAMQLENDEALKLEKLFNVRQGIEKRLQQSSEQQETVYQKMKP